MPSIQGIYYYFYAFYRRHNHISIKVTASERNNKTKDEVFVFYSRAQRNFADGFQNGS